MSTYLVGRDPNKYGGHQQSYLQQVDSIVEETAAAFHTAVEGKKDLEELFHETLATLGANRHDMAVAHKTKNADLFGIRRDQEPFASPAVITPLHHPYDEYNERLLPILQKHLRTMKHTLYEFEQKELKIEETCLGRAWSMEFAILSHEDMTKWGFSFNSESYQRLCTLCAIPPSQEPLESSHFSELVVNKTAMQNLKKASPEDYKRLKIAIAILEIREIYKKERKSDWVLVTVRSEIDGKMYALSQYLTWLNRNFEEDPVENMTNRSIISIIHQDPFLIEPMLKDIAKIFKKAIEWKDGNIKTLKEDVELLDCELHHAMPFKRGSAAVSEWLEKAIYRYHEFNLTYNPKKMVNLEALTSSFNQFVENYDSMIELTMQ